MKLDCRSCVSLLEQRKELLKKIKDLKMQLYYLNPTKMICEHSFVKPDNKCADCETVIFGVKSTRQFISLTQEVMCLICTNPMKTAEGCDGNCQYDKALITEIYELENNKGEACK